MNAYACELSERRWGWWRTYTYRDMGEDDRVFEMAEAVKAWVEAKPGRRKAGPIMGVQTDAS